MVSKELAKSLGVDQSMLVQQLHYWVEKNKENDKNYFNNKYWLYSTVKEMRDRDFPFWSEKTLRRYLNALSDKEIIIRRHFSDNASDSTYFYTIDYDVLASVCNVVLEIIPENTTEKSQNTDGQLDHGNAQRDGQVDHGPLDKMSTPFNKDKEINIKEIKKEINIKPSSPKSPSSFENPQPFVKSEMEEEGIPKKIPTKQEIENFVAKIEKENPDFPTINADFFYTICQGHDWRFNNKPIRDWKAYYFGMANRMHIKLSATNPYYNNPTRGKAKSKKENFNNFLRTMSLLDDSNSYEEDEEFSDHLSDFWKSGSKEMWKETMNELKERAREVNSPWLKAWENL